MVDQFSIYHNYLIRYPQALLNHLGGHQHRPAGVPDLGVAGFAEAVEGQTLPFFTISVKVAGVEQAQLRLTVGGILVLEKWF